jgi:molybdenum cofactor synthesis domain-containing protein
MSARAAIIRAAPGPPHCTRPVLVFTNAYAETVPNATGLTAIVMVGDEILSGHTQDTNSSLLARLAFAAGRPVAHIEVVADDPPAIVAAIRRAIDTPEISRIAVCGGIGPTPDDRTFQAVADALGRPLELNPAAYANIEALAKRMHAAGWIDKPEVSEANRRCAIVPTGATILANRRGMAPPLAIDLGGDRWLFVLPGIPREFVTIVEEELIPRYFAGAAAPVVREVHYRSVPESEMYEPMLALAREFPDVTVGSYPHVEQRELVIRLKGQESARVDAAVALLRTLRSDV